MNNKIYDKLTPQRKQMVDMVLENLQKGVGLWEQGWTAAGAPVSGITGKKYRGINNFLLTLISMAKGYKDNRWITFHQMEKKGWNFKTDEEGKSLAKGQGVPVEFYELRDKKTGKPFSRLTLLGMTQEEKDEYMKENVRSFRKMYRVFNADLIDGIPEMVKPAAPQEGVSDRLEKLLDYWSNNEAKILYGGDQAFYRPSTDEVHLPERNYFKTMREFYSTALHEMGHSTGHPSRLNRDMSGGFGSPEYAEEELRAEIASMFLEQDYGIDLDEKHLQNNSAYIKSWYDRIQENPNALFNAIADADKIAKYVANKEHSNIQKRIEYFAIVQDENELGDPTYKVYMTSAYGQTAPVLRTYESKEELAKEFGDMQQLPFWKDAEFQEVSFDELQDKSIEMYEAEQAAEEQSNDYALPSTIAAKAMPDEKVDMTARGVESLTRMGDREVVERASAADSEQSTFQKLYSGEKVYSSDEANDKHLMLRLAMYSDDKDQLLRVFKSSGQYNENKPNSYYTLLAAESMVDMETMKNSVKTTTENNKKYSGNYNAKR